MGCLVVDYSDKGVLHWADKKYALKDFDEIKRIITLSKREKIRIRITLPDNALETPYYYMFSVLAE